MLCEKPRSAGYFHVRLLQMNVRSTLLLYVAFVASASYADDAKPMMGKTTDEYFISAYCEQNLSCKVSMWKHTKDRDVHSRKSFQNEPCQQGTTLDKAGRTVFTFSCFPQAKSPLAGTSYVAQRVKGSCERGDPMFRYTCVSGCGRNSTAPQELTEDYYEC